MAVKFRELKREDVCCKAREDFILRDSVERMEDVLEREWMW